MNQAKIYWNGEPIEPFELKKRLEFRQQSKLKWAWCLFFHEKHWQRNGPVVTRKTLSFCDYLCSKCGAHQHSWVERPW